MESGQLDGAADHVVLAAASHSRNTAGVSITESRRDDRGHRLPNHLVGRVSEHLSGTSVPQHDIAAMIDRDDRIVGRFDDGLDPTLRYRKGASHLGPFCDVPDDAAEEPLTFFDPRCERQLDRELVAVTMEAEDLDRLAHYAGLSRCNHPREACRVRLAEPVGNEKCQRAACDLVGRVSEHPLGGGVPRQDAPIAPGHHDRIRGGLDNRLQ